MIPAQGSRFGGDTITMLDRIGDRLYAPGAALAEVLIGRVSAVRWNKGLITLDDPTNYPDRRIAGSPDRRIAGSPDRRIAGSPHLHSRLIMSAPALRDRSRPPSSPPEHSTSDRCSVAARPASHPDRFESLPARRLRHGLLSALLCLPLLALSFPNLAPQAIAAEVQTVCPGPRTADKKVTGGRWAGSYEERNIYGVGCLNVAVAPAYANYAQSIAFAQSGASVTEDSSKLYAFFVSSKIAPGPLGKPHGQYFLYNITLSGTAKKGEDYEFVYSPENQLGQRLYPLEGKGAPYGGYLFDSSKSFVLQGAPLSTVTSAFIFRILDDEEVEPDETVTFTIGHRKPSSGGQADYQIGTATATFTIWNNDGVEGKKPRIAIKAGQSSITEGASATFTVTATPAPSVDTAVVVRVAEKAGSDFVGSDDEGDMTVTIPAHKTTATLKVDTADDSADEPDGSVTATVNAGTGYTVISGQNSAAVVISDDDDPVVSVAAGSGVTEGEMVAFTLQAVPVPASPLDVTLTVSQDGDHVAAGNLGSRTVTMPVSGTVTVHIPTVDDDVDELAGTVTAALEAGTGYTLGATSSRAVEVADNDDPPAPTVSECVSDELIATAERLYEHHRHTPPEYAVNWFSVLVAFGQRTPDQWTADGRTISPMTAAAARQYGWQQFGNALECLEGTGPRWRPPGVYLYAAPPGDVSEAGDGKILNVFLGRALVAGEALRVPLVFGGTATLGTDYTLLPQYHTPLGVTHGGLAGPGVPTLTFTGPSAAAAKLFLKVAPDTVNEAPGETVTVELGTPTTAGFHGAVESGGTVTFTILESPPEITITATTASITEGADAPFTVTASRPPAADLTVRLTVTEAAGSDFVAAAHEGTTTVTIPAGMTEATVTVVTRDNPTAESAGAVTATLAGDGEDGLRYTVAPAPGDTASITVTDTDTALPLFSIGDETLSEQDGMMWFTVRLSKAAGTPVSVNYSTRESTPVSAREGVDYVRESWYLDFGPTETEKRFWIYVRNDGHNEGPETFEVVLSRPSAGTGIADGVAVGTIVNTDPLPAAWLARFGRTVAEQALDGIAGRLAAPRTPGTRGTLAGQPLPLATGVPATGGDPTGPAGPSRPGRPAHPPTPGETVALTGQDVLLGSHVTATGETDGTGGSLAFWGRAAQGHFAGQAGPFSLDGEATTAMLGADYARGPWLLGLALMQSTGAGRYTETDPPTPCLQPPDPPSPDPACPGPGMVTASLTAAVPYAAVQAAEHLHLWGALGTGTGTLTVTPSPGDRTTTTLDWTLAATGLRGAVIAPPRTGSGPALALTADALWARTATARTVGLAATAATVTRLRVGLEGSYRLALAGDGHLTPRLAVGARHDGGDAETGLGVELGGGLTWVAPPQGLVLELAGRTLIVPGTDAFKDRGLAVALAWDPAPATRRGPALTLRHDRGGPARDGLDALFATTPLAARPSSTPPASRWALEAAYGLPVRGDRFTGSPQLGFGLAPGARDTTLGWLLTPEAASAPDVTVGLQVTRRERSGEASESTAGLEATLRW